jgi:1,2-diacylglycerol 3-alpha-glucosyltransferase
MKILHCCLAAFYIDNYSYQENILPKLHLRMGHEVEILASTETYIDNKKIGYIKDGVYATKQGISVTRLPYQGFIPNLLVKKLRLYKGIVSYLDRYRPDVIFMHDCQFLSISSFVSYAKKNKVKIFVDCHTDFVNSGTNWLSKNVLHKIIYKRCAKKIEKYATCFYGTLPLRVEFLNKVYGIKKQKIKLLPFGADDTLFDPSDREKIRSDIREKLNIKKDDIVIITGGKIDKRKNIHVLGKAFIEFVVENEIKNIKLIIFGNPVEEMKAEIENLSTHFSVLYINWVPAEEIHTYFIASDIAFFPGTHSVLWEEAVGLGLPCIFLKWYGIEHVDLGGNCIFIDKADQSYIKDMISKIANDNVQLAKMNEVALNKGRELFSYTRIAASSIVE